MPTGTTTRRAHSARRRRRRRNRIRLREARARRDGPEGLRARGLVLQNLRGPVDKVKYKGPAAGAIEMHGPEFLHHGCTRVGASGSTRLSSAIATRVSSRPPRHCAKTCRRRTCERDPAHAGRRDAARGRATAADPSRPPDPRRRMHRHDLGREARARAVSRASRSSRRSAPPRAARLLVFLLFVVMALQNLGIKLLPLIAGLALWAPASRLRNAGRARQPPPRHRHDLYLHATVPRRRQTLPSAGEEGQCSTTPACSARRCGTRTFRWS